MHQLLWNTIMTPKDTVDPEYEIVHSAKQFGLSERLHLLIPNNKIIMEDLL